MCEEKHNNVMSDDISKLAEALSLAQGELTGAVKDAENPFFKKGYASLTSVWESCRSALSKNGLSVIQTTTLGINGSKAIVITTLAHKSGQWIRGTLGIKPIKDDPQSFGSALTYARRYALSAIVGIAPTDEDDGNLASGKGEGFKPSQSEPILKDEKAITERVKAIAKKLEADDKLLTVLVKAAGGQEKFSKMNTDEISKLKPVKVDAYIKQFYGWIKGIEEATGQTALKDMLDKSVKGHFKVESKNDLTILQWKEVFEGLKEDESGAYGFVDWTEGEVDENTDEEV